MSRIPTKIMFSLLILFFSNHSTIPEENILLTKDKTEQIENFIKKQMHTARIPGLSIVIVNKEKTVYQEGFGFSWTDEELPVSSETMFELGTNGNAFTALGILYLEKEGLLNLDDSIRDYLPWLKSNFRGKSVDPTIRHFLYQTSGIPFRSVGVIPSSDKISGVFPGEYPAVGDIELTNIPGRQFQDSPLNYYILGLVIDRICGRPFEDFISTNILKPLSLDGTCIQRTETEYGVNIPNMSEGHKLGYLKYSEIDTPYIRGSTPTGYFTSDSYGIARWLKIQLGTGDLPQAWKDLIKRSQIPDRTVPPHADDASYASGWYVHQRGSGELDHHGSNPGFSSYLIFRPADKIGIGVLANLNSGYSRFIGQGVLDIIQGGDHRSYEAVMNDTNRNTDNTSSAILAGSCIFSVVTLFQILLLIIDFLRGRRALSTFNPKNIISIAFVFVFLFYIAYCLYLIPDVLFQRLSWTHVVMWAPYSLVPSIVSLFISILLFAIYFQIIFYFPKKHEKPFFPLIILSFVSGFGNAFIIFTINKGLDNMASINIGLIVYFFLGIVIYVIGQRLIRTKMIRLTNNLIYETRIELIEKMLKSSFYQIENIEYGKIHACLNNDTEKLSNAPNLLIGCLTATITLFCCFIYLGTINIFGLLISIAIISLAAVLYYIVGRSANKFWNKARDIQNIFFRFVNDLISGFRELSLNYRKRDDFKVDMDKYCDEYKQQNISASLKFTNVFITGELLFILVIGAVAFIFPFIFKDIQAATLRTYIFIFLYLSGHVKVVLNNIPQLLRIRISWNRIKEFKKEVDRLTSASITGRKNLKKRNNHNGKLLKLEKIEFEYRNEDKIFKIGPVNYEFKAGEIVFITGGNGSGKTTLAKLITGLYKPDSGRILIHGESIDHTDLGEYYSNVFSDFHLFKKLYGIDYRKKEEEIKEKLRLLKIENKLKIDNGEFSTLELSSGQRKRIALLVSYIEDREIFLFDEWAADQDPEFRNYFYNNLIQELKRKNKCVIAITHDDQYFHVADKVIKMNMGKIEGQT